MWNRKDRNLFRFLPHLYSKSVLHVYNKKVFFIHTIRMSCVSIHPNQMVLRGTIVCAAAVRHRTPKFLYQNSNFGMTNLAVWGGGDWAKTSNSPKLQAFILSTFSKLLYLGFLHHLPPVYNGTALGFVFNTQKVIKNISFFLFFHRSIIV